MAAETTPGPPAPGNTGLDGAVVHVLLVGKEALPLAGVLPHASQKYSTHVDSFVEAILTVAPDALRAPYDLIIAGVGQDQRDLPAALTAFRKVHPAGRLVLLCAPHQEPLCRRAQAFGASDYGVLPVSAAQVRAWAAGTPQALPAAANGHVGMSPAIPPDRPPERVVRGAQPAAVREEPPPQLQLLALPMVVQTALMNDVLETTADLPGRALATLQSYFTWPGQLRIVPQAPPAEARDRILCAPLVQDDADFGFLLLENAPPDEVQTQRLSQAALWLTGWMLFAQRTRQLRDLAITDELSGAYNRRYFVHFVTQLLEKARTGHFRVTLLYFDIDDFKRYNDQYGHAAGDGIIRDMISLLRRCTRAHDLVARIGGDEFAVVFWDNEPPRQANSQHPRSALAATERFRKALASHDWQQISNITGHVSVSGGLATFPWDARTLDGLMSAADTNLLKAKKQGKNVIVLRETVDDEPVKS